MRLAPRLDRALLDRLRRIGHDEIHVELDDVAEAVAGRAGAERVVEREQPRLRIFVRDAARAALEALGEHDGRLAAGDSATRRLLDRPRGAAAFEIRRLDRIGQPLPHASSPFELHAIDDDLQRRAVARATPGRRRRTPRRGRRRAGGRSPLRRSVVDRRGDRAAGRGARHSRRRRRRLAIRTRRLCRRRFAQLVDLAASSAARRRRVDDRQIEADQQARARRQLAELARDDLGRLAHHLAAAAAAERPADAREQQPHVVVDLGRRADGRTRIADAVLLADRDRRRDAVDAIDVGLLHPLEKLPRVGRQRLDVAPLPFGVDRVEGERRLPRSADAGDDDQLAGRQRQIDVLEVVRARAPDDDVNDVDRVDSVDRIGRFDGSRSSRRRVFRHALLRTFADVLCEDCAGLSKPPIVAQ